MLTLEDIKRNETVNTYITRADESLSALGFTEHSFAHVAKSAEVAGYILETLGLIFYLHPYSANTLKRTIKTPKLYFYDSGVVAYLARWSSVETLMNGAQCGAILENYVISEVTKGYYNSGREPYLYYYNNKDGKEIDLLWESDGTLFPLEIKKTSNPGTQLTNIFRTLEKSGKIVGRGGVICLRNEFIPLDKNNSIIPIRCV